MTTVLRLSCFAAYLPSMVALAVAAPAGAVVPADYYFDNLRCDPNFERLDWIGFASHARRRAIYYIDDIEVGTSSP